MATLAGKLASLIEARANCERTGNHEWHARYSEAILTLAREQLPHGSGIDSGCVVMTEESSPDKLVIHVPFHCMENGCYDGWRDYRVTVRPTFDSISVTVTGRDYNGLKDYLGELFHETLTRTVAPC